MLDEVLFLAPYPDSVDDTSCSSSAAVLGHWCPITYTFAATNSVVDLLLILQCFDHNLTGTFLL